MAPRIRSRVEDFEVEELPLYAPAGEGRHTLVLVEKRGVDTETVVRDLARRLAVEPLEIGYAGRKDRRALTRQWLSLPRLEPGAALAISGPGWRVLEAARHHDKLRAGELAGNRFRVVVRELPREAAEEAAARLEWLGRRGLVNRFGPQRFGRGGDNAAAGVALLREGRVRGDRRRARFLVSALQSELFNRVLERRPAPPCELLDGDLALEHASGRLVRVADAAALAPRAEALELSATGPLYGRKMRAAAGAVAALEEEVWRELGLGSWRDLAVRGLPIEGGRRALRVPVAGASARPVEGGLELRFELPPGSYATVLVEELFPGQEVEEGGGGGGGAEEGD